MKERKYDFTGETKIHGAFTLHRIIAARQVGSVAFGTLGGWVYQDINLSHDGDCWVADEAKVFGNSRVTGSAIIQDEAEVCGDAIVSDEARVMGDSFVGGNAHVCGRQVVNGDALF